MKYKLTDVAIRKARPAPQPQPVEGKKKVALKRMFDAGGLFLEVRPTGAKYWRYAYRLHGKAGTATLGEYYQPPLGESPENAGIRRQARMFTLEEARQEHAKARILVKAGRHPIEERKRQKRIADASAVNTFRAVASEWMQQKRDNDKWTELTLSRNKKTFDRYLNPIADLPIREVSSPLLLEIVQKLGKKYPTAATQLLGWCSSISKYAASTLRVDSGVNPAALLSGAVTKPPVKHKKALPEEGIPILIEKIKNSAASRQQQIALQLILLLFVRQKELRLAAWSEFNLDKAEWHIPAERMKMRRPHYVPLSIQAVELLRELHKLTGDQKWLFPNSKDRKKYMADSTLNRILGRLGYKGEFSVHASRATARTLLERLGVRKEVVAKQLAHESRDKVDGSYNLYEYHEERKRLLQFWADHIDKLCSGKADTDKVIPLHQAA